jgi:MFS family permease
LAIAPAPAGEAAAGGQNFGSIGYRTYVLIVLTMVYTLNFIDRNLLGVVSQPVIAEFGLSDSQFGFLAGPPFALFYAIMGIPIAMMADRFNRVVIISVCIAIWSVATALCGLAQDVTIGGVFISGFLFLLMSRVLVAIGEAGSTPPSNSILGDYYRPRARAAALGIFAMGVTLGGALANAFGGTIAGLHGPSFGNWLNSIGLSGVSAMFDWSKIEGWRIAFIMIGAPGVLIALLCLLTVKEPPRGYSDPPGTPKAEKASILETLKELLPKPTFWFMAIGAALVAFVGYGHFTFQAPMAQRVSGIGTREFALNFGVQLALLSAVGTFLGGWLTEKLSPRFNRAVAIIPGIGLLLAIPLYVSGFYLIDQTVITETESGGKQLSGHYGALAVWGLGAMCHYAYLGAQYTIGQGVVSARGRASAIAILLLLVALIGNGIGPQIVGILSDVFMGNQIADSGMGDTLTNEICRARDLSNLAPDAQAVCRKAYGEGLRQSLVAVTLVFIPAAILFFLSAVTLKKDMIAKTH